MKKPKHRPVRNLALYRAMQEIRRSNATVPIPAGKHKGSRRGRKKEAIRRSWEGN